MAGVILADLLARGVRIEPHEALAVAQQLVHSAAAAPSPANVRLSDDGRACCVGCDVTPTVFEIGILLQTLIPPGAPRVAGALRYAIARALHEVDAFPFDSLDDLSRSLERFETGDRRAVVRRLLERSVAPPLWPRAVPAVPPRRAATAPPPTLAPASNLQPIPFAEAPDPLPRRRVGLTAAAALLTGAVAWLGVAGVMKAGHVRPRAVAGAVRGHTPAPAPVVEPKAAPIVATAAAAAAERAAVATPSPPPADGDVVAALDRDRRPIFSPAFASNGSALFFHTGSSRDARSAIATTSADPGTGELAVMTILDDGARNYHVRPSPDGRLVAFDSDRDGERGVYIADRDGSNVRRISGPGYAAAPSWAPDGLRIAYIRAETGNPKVWNLWVQSLADSRLTRLTRYRYGQPWSASWFPDNRRVCFSHEDTLVVLDLESGDTETFRSPIDSRLVRTPAVSPDGRQVIFQVHRAGAWMLDLEDGAMRMVLADPTAEEFAWSPDGRRVAFHSRRDGEWGIFVVAPR